MTPKKCRGKSISNIHPTIEIGDWVYGYYIQDKNDKGSIYTVVATFDTSYLDVFVEVDPETVGEFVCKDKNSKDVFAESKGNYMGQRVIVKQNDGDDDDFGYHLECIDLPANEPINTGNQTGKRITNISYRILYRDMCKEIELIEEPKDEQKNPH